MNNYTDTYYTEEDNAEIAELFIGRKVVRAEMGSFPIKGRRRLAEGLLVLDDGTELYLTGNDGGCLCDSGCYPLEKLATVDNIITSAHVNADPAGDHLGVGELNYRGSGAGVYQIFVFADAKAINVAEFRGTDGNGYYGTGFSLTVIKPAENT